MKNYLVQLAISEKIRSLTIADAIYATTCAFHPETRIHQLAMIYAIHKVDHISILNNGTGCVTALSEDDWQRLRVIWSHLNELMLPMLRSDWQPYLDAFLTSPIRPKEWDLEILATDAGLPFELKRVLTSREHENQLRIAIAAGIIRPQNQNPSTTAEFTWNRSNDEWQLNYSDLKIFCDLLSIELLDAPLLANKADEIAQQNIAPETSITEQATIVLNEAAANGWNLPTPQRYPGYRYPVYIQLKLAHQNGKPCPSAREVLDAWRIQKPPDLLEVGTDCIKYYDKIGNIKNPGLKQIQQTIKYMLNPPVPRQKQVKPMLE